MIVFEALEAAHGDSLLVHDGKNPPGFLWLIDGGPSGVLDKSVMKRLPQLAAAGKPPHVTWGMVSHIDDDHINGMEALTGRLVSAIESAKPKPVTFDRFWFNSFSSLVGPAKPAARGAQPSAEPAAVATALPIEFLSDDPHSAAIIESVGQGEGLTQNLKTLGLTGNPPFDGVVSAPFKTAQPIDTARITVLGPRKDRLEALRKSWAAAMKKTPEARKAALQDLFLPEKSLDRSVPNLSSIVVLAEFPNCRILLTGDARGDDVVAGWKEANGGKATPRPIDILKAPHHGSERGITAEFLNTFPARHYVFSANGKFDNPDARVVEAVVATQDKRDITLHFTNGDITWSKPFKMDTTGKSVGTLAELIGELKKRPGTRATYDIRAGDALSVRIELP